MTEALLWALGVATLVLVVFLVLRPLRGGRRIPGLPDGVEPILTSHARQRMEQRGITSEQMSLVLRTPQQVREDVAQKSFVLQREISGRTLKVMVAETWPPKSSPIIKTTAWGNVSATIEIPASQCGRVIGAGGRTVQDIQHRSGARISVKPDGTVRIAAEDWAPVEAAKRAIETITSQT